MNYRITIIMLILAGVVSQGMKFVLTAVGNLTSEITKGLNNLSTMTLRGEI